VVRFTSRDLQDTVDISDQDELAYCDNPADPFALHKAAVQICGLAEVRGFSLTTSAPLPKGSGLGTSSILSAVAVMALMNMSGQTAETQDVGDRVLCMEQLMTTGGGWQDQFSVLVPGIKLLQSRPGIGQKISVRPLELAPEVMEALESRLILVYTGQRRLARNLLRTVVGGAIEARPQTLSTLNEIQRIAVLMAFELERGNLSAFGELMTEHWKYSQLLDAASTNNCIDLIFSMCSDLLEGRMICGAGGGGFLQMLLREGLTVEDITKRLESAFSLREIQVYNISIYG
jgi:fucokinase